MKKIVISMSLIFICLVSNAQADNQLNKMLVESLHTFLTYKSKLQKDVCSNCRETTIPYICKDGLPVNFPYASFPHITFFSVDFFTVYPRSFKKQLKNGINVLFVNFELKNNRLKIAVSNRYVKLRKKRQIDIAISDWGHYFYKYSCEKGEWLLEETKFEGV